MIRSACAGRRVRWLALVLLLAASSAMAQSAGEFTFGFCIRGYDEDTRFGEPSSIAISERSDVICLADVKDATLYVFNLQGLPKSIKADAEKLKAPYAVGIDKDGTTYVAGRDAGPVRIIGSDGRISDLELEAPEGDEPPKPGRMAFDRDGNLYVVDRTNSRLYVFDKDRKLKMRVGGKGNKRGEFRQLTDAAVDRQGRIYALDSVGVPVQVFDKKGKYLYRFGFRGAGDQDIGNPAAIALDRNDQVWIVDKGRHCLKVFDRAGEFLRRLGSYGVGEGTLFEPVDIEIDNFGKVYIAESGARRIQVFIIGRAYETFTPASQF